MFIDSYMKFSPPLIAKKYSLLVYLLIGFLFAIKGQYTAKINTLKTAIINENNSVNLSDLYLELSSAQIENENEEALKNAFQSLSISQSVHYTKGTINALHQIGIIYTLQQKYDKAIIELQLANEMALTYANYKDVALGNLLLAKAYWLNNLTEKAIENINTAYNLCKKTKNTSLEALCNIYNGDLQLYLNKKNLALEYYLVGYKMALDHNETATLAEAAFKIGIQYNEQKKIDKAIEYLILSNQSFELLKDKKNTIKVSYEIGNIYLGIGNTNEAISYFKKCLEKAQEIGYEFYIKNAYQNIAQTYEKNKSYKEAYEYLQFYAAIKDTREITELEAQIQLEKTNKALELISKENELNRNQIEKEIAYRNFGIIVILIILALMLFLYLSLRQRGKINSQLKLATQEATRSKQEKEDFFAYTSHEIRTPLNAVVGVSKLLAATETERAATKIHQNDSL